MWIINFCAPLDQLLVWNRRVFTLHILVMVLFFACFKLVYDAKFSNSQQQDKVSDEPVKQSQQQEEQQQPSMSRPRQTSPQQESERKALKLDRKQKVESEVKQSQQIRAPKFQSKYKSHFKKTHEKKQSQLQKEDKQREKVNLSYEEHNSEESIHRLSREGEIVRGEEGRPTHEPGDQVQIEYQSESQRTCVGKLCCERFAVSIEQLQDSFAVMFGHHIVAALLVQMYSPYLTPLLLCFGYSLLGILAGGLQWQGNRGWLRFVWGTMCLVNVVLLMYGLGSLSFANFDPATRRCYSNITSY